VSINWLVIVIKVFKRYPSTYLKIRATTFKHDITSEIEMPHYTVMLV